MRHQNQKFMVELLHGLSQKQIFFLIWFLIAGAFTLLMLSYYRKTTRRNFRTPGEGQGPRFSVDTRRLPEPTGSQIVVVKDGVHPTLPSTSPNHKAPTRK